MCDDAMCSTSIFFLPLRPTINLQKNMNRFDMEALLDQPVIRHTSRRHCAAEEAPSAVPQIPQGYMTAAEFRQSTKADLARLLKKHGRL
jgi:hypothetical protein